MIGSAWIDFILGIYLLVAALGFPVVLYVAGFAMGWVVARNKVLRQETTALVDRMFSTKEAKGDNS